ncbi:MAG TPA: hypothetical protein VEQ60_24135, partial [Longimicrobium sp.]|nr:hypothetical protein [Longimicrobium sp.]
MSQLQLNKTEQEIVLLTSAIDLIDGVVNFELFRRQWMEVGTPIVFQSSAHQRLVNILLIDFLTQTDPERPDSLWDALSRIAQDPQFDVGGSVANLATPVRAFQDWLTQEEPLGLWLPSMGAHVKLNLPRIAYIRMCGNIGRHDLPRLFAAAEQLQAALSGAGGSLELEDAMIALEDFERYRAEILNDHGNAVVEMLIDIRWGIHEYLTPEFERSHDPEDRWGGKHRFHRPAAVQNRFAQERYTKLMNQTRRGPAFPRLGMEPLP